MPVRRVFRAAYVALGQRTGRPSAPIPLAQVSRLTNFSASSRLAVDAIENIEESVAVGMQQEFSILSAELRIDENVGLVRIPIVSIVRSELVIPLQFAGRGIERQHAIRKQIVAAPFAIVGIRPRITRRPKSVSLSGS